MRNYIALFLLVLCSSLNAQNEHEVITEDGKTYCVHKIQKGETLYALSKKYDVRVKDIEQSNAGLTANLKLGQALKIPCDKAETKIQAKTETKVIEKMTQITGTTVDEFKGNYIFHTIAVGETVYSITKKIQNF